ncbi:hypothetical protein MASR1M68_16620 [Elusimicrobiota bacterium]
MLLKLFVIDIRIAITKIYIRLILNETRTAKIIVNAVMGNASGERDFSNIWNKSKELINMKLTKIDVSLSMFESFV